MEMTNSIIFTKSLKCTFLMLSLLRMRENVCLPGIIRPIPCIAFRLRRASADGWINEQLFVVLFMTTPIQLVSSRHLVKNGFL